MRPAGRWASLLARGWCRPDPAGAAVGVQQREAHFVAHRKHNHYFVPNDPDAYERAKQAWTSPRPSRLPPPPSRPKMPDLEVEWPSEHIEKLKSTATQAGLSERTAERVVRAAKRGYAPSDLQQLKERIEGLFELRIDSAEKRAKGQPVLPNLDVDRMLSLSTTALSLSPSAMSHRAKYLSKLLPGRDIGQLLSGASSWAVRAPRELATRLEGLEELWEGKLGQQLPQAHLRSPRRLERMVRSSSRRTARHMDTMLASHGQATSAQLYRKCPDLLSYRAGVLNSKVAALRRTLGTGREAVEQLVEREPGVLKVNAVGLRNRLRGLEALFEPAFWSQEQQAAAKGAAGAQSAARTDAASSIETHQQQPSGTVVAQESGMADDLPIEWTDGAAAAAAAAAVAAVQRQPSLLKYLPRRYQPAGARRKDRPSVFDTKMELLSTALGLSLVQVASMVAAHPALLTRSSEAMKATAIAIASMPQGSALGLDGKAVSEVVLAAPAALGLSAGAVEARLQALAALAGLGPAWMGHMCDLAADRAALGAALTQLNARYERLRWLVAGRRQAQPVPGALELLRMEQAAFSKLHAGYPGE